MENKQETEQIEENATDLTDTARLDDSFDDGNINSIFLPSDFINECSDDTPAGLPIVESANESTEISDEQIHAMPEETQEDREGVLDCVGKCESANELLDKASVPPSNTVVLKKSHLAIGAIAIALLLTGAVLLGMWINRGHEEIDPNAIPYNGALTSPPPTADQIALPGYSDIVFPAGQRDVQIVLPNPEGNRCYFVFSFVLDETGEELYRSGLIPSGMAVTEVRLSRPLDAGVYTLRICIEPLSLDKQTPLNGGIYETVLTVKNP